MVAISVEQIISRLESKTQCESPNHPPNGPALCGKMRRVCAVRSNRYDHLKVIVRLSLGSSPRRKGSEVCMFLNRIAAAVLLEGIAAV
jgi:hypothetical protein